MISNARAQGIRVTALHELARRVRMDARALVTGQAKLVTGARFLLFAATALWVPVLLIPGDTTATSLTYDTIRTVAAWLGLPHMDVILSPGELLLAGVASLLCAFSALDYAWGGSRRVGARVYLACLFWIAIAASYLLANPLAYGTWLFTGFALLSVWCLRVVRREEGQRGGNRE
jgi:membrane protein implicated in regulation of membrane protease activity